MASVIIGDYRYESISTNEARVKVINNSKSSYDAILSSVTIDGVEYSITDIAQCFQNCTALTTAPEIHSGVTNMSGCFRGCTSLTTPPEIPSSVKNMFDCFRNCTSLTTPPEIPNGVIDIPFCFSGCTSLITAPEIPESVIDMVGCFQECTSLITAPEIPSSVTRINLCFSGCTLLTGNIIVHNNPYNTWSDTPYSYVFDGTTQPIKICPANVNVISTWQKIANEYSNVSMGLDLITYTFLSSRRLTSTENTTYGTTRGVRIDMLLDCGDSYAITGMTPSSGRLYAIDGTQITFPYYSPNLLRCYLIYESSNQVPTSKLTITIQNINTTFNSLQVYLPTTATISQFEQLENSETTQLAPQINNLGSIVFNPQGSGASTNIAQLVPLIYQSATGNTLTPLINDNKTQINTLKSDSTLDIKHFVTTADNIQVTTDKTLQDIITECYNALGT